MYQVEEARARVEGCNIFGEFKKQEEDHLGDSESTTEY